MVKDFFFPALQNNAGEPTEGESLIPVPALTREERKKNIWPQGGRKNKLCPSRLHSVALGQMNQHVYLLIQLSSFQSVMPLKGNELF